MIAYILSGIGWGFSAATIPGPLLSFLIGTTLSYGWRRGLIVVVAPLLTDLPIIVVMTFLLSGLSPDAERLLRLVGGLYVLRLAWLSYADYRAGAAIGADIASDAIPVSAGQTLRQAILMNLISPGPYIFWSAITGPILRDALNDSILHAVVFLVCFYGVFLGLMAVWVMLFDRLRTVDARVTRWTLLISIFILAGFGLQMIAQGLTA